jgi:predicted XRE-type DNA-binding protein
MTKRNIFLAMGFEPEDAMVQAVRADLADAIAALLDERDLTQVEASELLGLPQGVVSNIVRGRVEHLSIERLMRAMVRAGIPGYAKWPTADTAKAGVLYSSAVAPTVSSDLEFAEPIEGLFGSGEGDYQPELEAQ